MDHRQKPTILCISTYEKGQPFLQEAARLGCNVILLTLEKHLRGDWPRESLTELITMPEGLAPEQVLNVVSYLACTRRFDRIVALDEFDLEVAALLREHMRLPGMGASDTRHFCDRLAMRVRARQGGVPVPEYTSIFHYDEVRGFLDSVPGPWLLKPRTNGWTVGVRRIEEAGQLWPILDELGELQSHYLLERFVPGEIFHVESITWKHRTLFSAPYKYGRLPLQAVYQGGVFSTRALDRESNDALQLEALQWRLIDSLGLEGGVTHSEFIKSEAEGAFCFLETTACVGGGSVADVVELASGVNLWVEWARLEAAAVFNMEYVAPQVQGLYAGSVIGLARQEVPDLDSFDAPEVVLRLNQRHHAGLLLQADSAERIEILVQHYSERFLNEFCAFESLPDRPKS